MNHIQSPATGDQAIERDIVAAGANKAPRVTPADIEANIASEHYFTADESIQGALAKRRHDLGVENPRLDLLTLSLLSLLNGFTVENPRLALRTLCVLTLRNGFTVTGESACASPENFDAEISKKIAREHAIAKVWPLMGYALNDRLAK
jgi:hypothetical protein